MAKQKTRLGRGLGGLISQGSSNAGIATVEATARLQTLRNESSTEGAASQSTVLGGYAEIETSRITTNPFQPRKEMDEAALEGLAESIREEGLIQPIVVRKAGEGFELIAGERRLRAYRKLNLNRIPARIIEASDASSATLALIENLQREGLNPIEEALGFASLIQDFGLTQEKASERLGKSRASVANSIRLLRLPPEVQGYLTKGLLSTGHAKVVLSLEDDEAQKLFARRAVEQSWSVREAERQIDRFRKQSATPSNGNPLKDSTRSASENTAVKDLEKRVSELLTAQTQLKHGSKQGRLIIHYRGLDDLQRILEKIGLDKN